jgi:hypothetical protein
VAIQQGRTTVTNKQFQQYLQAHQLQRTRRIAERIADVLVNAWREISAPPRPAWIIVERRETTRTADRYYTFAPR